MLDVGGKKLLCFFFNLFISGMSCTAQSRGKKEKNMFSLKRIIVKFTVWKLPLACVMGLCSPFLHAEGFKGRCC